MKPDFNRRPFALLRMRSIISAVMLPLGLSASMMSIAAPTIPETPLVATQSAVPLSMMVVGRDHTLFFEAYNDASDLDGDGALELHFKPSISYYGLFDSNVCYTQSSGGSKNDLFTPSTAVDNNGKCSGKWHGNWLNYVTTSRIDALRKVFYGGQRDPASTSTNTILRRAYIPQDGHSWAKEYTSISVDGYDISDYTPLSVPSSGKRHFFGNLTNNVSTNCNVLNNCSDLAPWLSVVTNSNKRVWEWASSERPVLSDSTHGGTRKNYTVRVQVCTETFNEGCKRYPNGSLKPTGLLHEYGENEAMYFGLLTGSYNRNMSGGVLRKVMSSFKGEVDQNTGDFTANAAIVKAMDSLRIRDFNNGNTSGSYRKGSFRTGPMIEGDYPDWGNPVGEMMYEAMRYFAGKKTPSSAFSTSGSHDGEVFKGQTPPAWDDPYSSTSAAKADWCAKPNLLVMSSVNISYDSDQVPGSAFNTYSGDLSDLSVSALGDKISTHEPSVKGKRYIGAVGGLEDFAPTAKDVTTLGNLRGLAPEEPTKQGSYYSSSIAHYGKTTDLNSIKGDQKTDTYVVALASPMPKLEFTVGGQTISLVPFAKTIDGASTDRKKGKYQATDQIVDFYVEEYTSERVKFRINYEADEQGNDFDMDVVAEYEIVNSGGTLTVSVKPTYESTGSNQNVGYVITGTAEGDGVYLVAQDKNESLNYYLNVPPGKRAGYCDSSTNSDPATFPAGCGQLPWIDATPPGNQSVQVFTSGSAATASTLKNPLWFAAKWGGFIDRNGNGIPDLSIEWDLGNDGTPDNYFLVQNPTKLKEALKKSFDTIVERSASAGNITSNGQQLQTDSRIFQTQFNSKTWDGDLLAYAITTSGVSATPTWRASTGVPAAGSRKLFSWDTSDEEGIEFEWSKLSSPQQTALGSEDVFDYLRGVQSKEVQNAGVYRTRAKMLGDIVHSSPYYVKDTGTVFVGGNDGMLHAFSATTGAELFGYVPGLTFSKLATLASTTYDHTFFVDGDIAVSTTEQTSNKNILVASTGRGAKGLFALDVTTPSSFSKADALWEYSGASDDDFGFVLGRPQIGTLESGVTVAVVGNGHNSVSGYAKLYIFNLESGLLLSKLDTMVSGDNGMSTPTLIDADGNGKVDTIYAGDLKGNVWRFDVSNTSPSAWQSHYRSGSTPLPLFTAKDSSGVAQPINAQLTVAINSVKSDSNYGKRYVLFGTGSYVYGSDPNDKQVQSWYGIIDQGAKVASRTDLRQRTIDSSGTVSGYGVRVFSSASKNDMDGKKGWYLDLKDPTARGERIVTRSIVYGFLEPVLIASSIIPDPDPCEAGGSGYVNAINPYSGARLEYSPFDMNDDAKFDEGDKLSGAVIGSFDPKIGMPGEATVVGDQLIVSGSSGGIADMRVNYGTKRTGRISWREVVRD